MSVDAYVWIEIALLASITLLAGFLRFYDLGSLPHGMHGDEAVAGLEGQRVLDHGTIGLYSPLAAGQPSGPLYPVAVMVFWFGHTLVAVRYFPALIGALTIPLLYLVVCRSLGRPAGMAAALALAVMAWHIHFARIGFPLESWPFAGLLAVGALIEAIKRSSAAWWAGAGALLAAGIYVYNGHPLFALIVGLFAVGWLAVNRRVPLANRATWLGAFLAAGGVVALPMAAFAADSDNDYLAHFERDTVTASADWKQLDGTLEHAAFALDRYRDFWMRLSFEPKLDGVDATGITAIVPRQMLLLAGAGLALALARRRSPLVGLGLAVLLVMPLGSVFTIDGLARRTFLMAPFLALFCGLAVTEGLDLLAKYGRRVQIAATLAAVTISGSVAYSNVHNYFWTFRNSPHQEWVFVTEFTESVNFIARQEPDTYVYYLSDRWSFNYEPRAFVAGSARGEDRSREFGKYNLATDPAQGRPVFVLLGAYKQVLPDLQRLYPGGTLTVGGGGSAPAFLAYAPP